MLAGMRIVDVRMSAGDLGEAVAFYRDVLELPVAVAMSGAEATVAVGTSTITLVQDAAVVDRNHLAFTVPADRFADAKAWVAERVELMRWGADDAETTLELTAPWNSESAYFRGPGGVILEVIARHDLANAASGPFSSAHLLCVSEVGLATPDVPGEFARMRQTFGMGTFAGESPDFTTVGDARGLLILVTEGRPWFPTSDVGAASPGLWVTIEAPGSGVVRSAAGWVVTSS